MQLQRIKISSYAGFEETDWIDLSSGINVVAGRNNSGKSSFLKCVTASIERNPHKNASRSLPGQIKEQRIDYCFLTSSKELVEKLEKTEAEVAVQVFNGTTSEVNVLLEKFRSSPRVELNYFATSDASLRPATPTFLDRDGPNVSVVEIRSVGGQLRASNRGMGGEEDLYKLFSKPYGENTIFYLPSERYHVAKTALGRHTELSSDTANLSGFLQFLQGNFSEQFEQIEENLCRVIPSIERISIDTLRDGFQILIWPEGAGGNRNLALTLDECGTGVSQVLSIFAIVATNQNAIIAVDEINSFLHPQAVKDLISILASEYAHNQYIISTHSSDVLTHPSIQRIIYVKRDGFSSTVEAFAKDDLDRLKDSMRGLGISMGDVLGAENFLWVEGPTEEIVFPNIISEIRSGVPRGLRISSVNSTGDFDRKKREKKELVRIYDHVRKQTSPLSSGGAFLLDRESLSDGSIDAVRKETDGRLRVTSRRTIENYVLEPSAIALLLEEELGGEETFEVQKILGKIIEVAQRKEFKTRSKFDENLNSEGWLKEVDGARLLKCVIGELSDHRLEFRKTDHTPRLFSKVDNECYSELICIIKERLEFLGY